MFNLIFFKFQSTLSFDGKADMMDKALLTYTTKMHQKISEPKLLSQGFDPTCFPTIYLSKAAQIYHTWQTHTLCFPNLCKWT